MHEEEGDVFLGMVGNPNMDTIQSELEHIFWQITLYEVFTYMLFYFLGPFYYLEKIEHTR